MIVKFLAKVVTFWEISKYFAINLIKNLYNTCLEVL